jgi:glutathione peroxidase
MESIMKKIVLFLLSITILFADTSIYDFEVKTIEGNTVKLDKYKDKVMLIVNVASKCGFTPQYEGLENLHKKYSKQGLALLGFPCNQFLSQEPGTNKEIASFCRLTYGVEFDMFSKIDVNGENTHPLYVYLKKEAPGFLGSEAIKWNFTKFLVNRKGKVYKRYSSSTLPKDIEKDIVKLLNQN